MDLSSKKFNKYGLGGRIKELLGKEKQKDFAKRLGFSGSYISAVVTGVAKPSLELIFKIQQIKNCNLHWLLTGEGEKDISKPPEALREHRSPYSPSKRQEIIEFLNESSKNEDIILRVIRLKKETREVLAALQEDLEPEPTKP